MTIDPKEQAFLDNLKAEFKKDGKQPSRIERKVLEVLERNFDAKDTNGNEVITGAADVMKIIKSTVNDDKQELTEHMASTRKDITEIDQALKKVGGIIDIGKAKNKVVKAAKEAAVLADERHLKETKEFGDAKNYAHIKAMADGQLPAKTTVATVSTDAPATDTPTAAATQPAATSSGSMTPSEAAFLKEFKTTYGLSNRKGELSGLEQRVYNELEAEFNKPGQTGWKEIGGITYDVQSKMIAGVKDGSLKISEVLDKGIVPSDDNAITNNINETKHTETLGESTKRTKALNKLAAQKIEIGNKFETKILEQFNPNSPVNKAKEMGFPEDSIVPTPLQMAITNAAGADKILDSKELQGLLKDPKFLAAAQQVTGEKPTKIGVHNDAEKGKDTLRVGGTDVPLGDTGVELDAAVKDGDVSLPKATPAKAAPAKKGGRH